MIGLFHFSWEGKLRKTYLNRIAQEENFYRPLNDKWETVKIFAN